jgi:hypothetical protein
MSTPPLPGMGSSFQEPTSPDQTSAPQEQIPQPQMPQILQQRSKKKGFGPNVKNPGALAGAIARSKRARQTGDKWGS